MPEVFADKQIRPLCRHAMAGLDLGSTGLPDKRAEVKLHADKMQVALIHMAQYILMLHSDVVHRRKLAAFTAIGMKDHEATGQYRNALLDMKISVFMKSVNKHRRARATVMAEAEVGGLARGQQYSDNSAPGVAAQSTSQSAPKEHSS